MFVRLVWSLSVARFALLLGKRGAHRHELRASVSVCLSVE